MDEYDQISYVFGDVWDSETEVFSKFENHFDTILKTTGNSVYNVSITNLVPSTDYLLYFQCKTFESGLATFPRLTKMKSRTDPDVPQFRLASTSKTIVVDWSAAPEVTEISVEIVEPHLVYANPRILISDDRYFVIEVDNPSYLYSIRVKCHSSYSHEDGHSYFEDSQLGCFCDFFNKSKMFDTFTQNSSIPRQIKIQIFFLTLIFFVPLLRYIEFFLFIF
jgi:hypothetical protein